MSIELLPTGVIYALFDPRTQTLRYIGKTTAPLERRLQDHLKACVKNHSYAATWLRGLRVAGIRPKAVIIERLPTADLPSAERRWIALARNLGVRLTNLSDGGEGGMSSDVAKQTWTPERRERRRKSIAAAWARPEVKGLIRAKLRAAWADPIRRAARINQMCGRPLTSEHRAKIVASWDRRGRKIHTPRLSRSAAQQLVWQRPGERERRSAAMRSACRKPYAAGRIPAGAAGINARKRVCKNGHLFTKDNTAIISTTGERRCIICRREADHRRYCAVKQRRPSHVN